MKKYIIALILCTVLLTGCAGNDRAAVTAEGSSVTFNEIGVSAQFPASWTVYANDGLYEQIYRSYSDSFESAEEMKTALSESGLQYLAYGISSDLSSMVTISVQDMTVDVYEDFNLSTEEYARSVHDTSIFSYQSSGYKIKDGSFAEAAYGGRTGYLSNMEIISADEDAQLVIGMSEFTFENGSDIYTVQICYSDENGKSEALSVLDSMTVVTAE